MDKGNKAAFPRVAHHGDGRIVVIQRGMNLLEYYGGQALAGILASGQKERVPEAAWGAAKEMVENHPYVS